MMDLWSPHAGTSLMMILATAYLLGLVHGITPDEHTWPITFSYAIGSYSTRKGMAVGLFFSLAFTLQRAIASELAYFALASIMSFPGVDYIVYLVVGMAMFLGGLYIFRFKNVLHIHFGRVDRSHHAAALSGTLPDIQPPTIKMAVVHGFIAGFGFGAFALIIYSTLAPAMPSPYWGWLPGFLFGLGTTTVQLLAGAAFGMLSRHLKLPPEAAARVSGLTAGRTLTWGGLLFFLAGAFGLLYPSLAGYQLTTPFYIHNLHHIGIAFALVIVVVMVIGMGTLIIETHRIQRRLRELHL